MPENAALPVFIFLPKTESEPNPDRLVTDPVCGRTLAHEGIAGRLLHHGRHHYFCSLECAEHFAARPAEFNAR